MGKFYFLFVFLLFLGITTRATKKSIFDQSNGFNIPTTQYIPYSVGGALVTFNDVPRDLDLKCIIESGRGNIAEVTPEITLNGKAICRISPEVSVGNVRVNLEANAIDPHTSFQGRSTETIFTQSDLQQIQVTENWDNDRIDFIWDASYFEEFYNPGEPIVLAMNVFILNGTRTQSEFIQTSVIQAVGLNQPGRGGVTVSESNLQHICGFRYPYYYVLRPAGTQSDIYLTSALITPTACKTEPIARDICDEWFSHDNGPPPQSQRTPCPNCLCKATLDRDFIATSYPPEVLKLAGGRLANHQLFYEKVPTSGGHAQSCSYNTATDALATSSPAQAAYINYNSKQRSYLDNYVADVWPYIVCCLQSNSQESCSKFHQKRPIDTGHNYPGADEPCDIHADPHIITFDGTRYDFQGFGEFWLVKGPSTGGVQGRMSTLYEGAQVTYFKAVAVKEGDTTVQIQLINGAVQVILKDEVRATTTLLNMTQAAGQTISVNDDLSVTVDSWYGTTEVRMKDGFGIRMTSAVQSHFKVQGFGAQRNKVRGYRGLLGAFDGNPDNDLTNRDGYVIPPSNENLRNLSLIHNTFGLTWMTTPQESFFVYEDGLSWESYQNVSFGPIFEYPDPNDLPEEVREICGNNLACYYEYIGTGNLDDAEEAVEVDKEHERLKEEVDKVILLCEELPSPLNMSVAVEGYLVGSVANYSCTNDEYEMNGTSSRTCVESGGSLIWDGEEPTCTWTCGACTEDIEYRVTPDPTDCRKYFLCAFGERFFLVCPEGENFNRETLICDKDYECEGQPGCK